MTNVECKAKQIWLIKPLSASCYWKWFLFFWKSLNFRACIEMCIYHWHPYCCFCPQLYCFILLPYLLWFCLESEFNLYERTIFISLFALSVYGKYVCSECLPSLAQMREHLQTVNSFIDIEKMSEGWSKQSVLHVCELNTTF